MSDEPPIRAMLSERGFVTRHAQDVELWKMFHAMFLQMRQIARELEPIIEVDARRPRG